MDILKYLDLKIKETKKCPECGKDLSIDSNNKYCSNCNSFLIIKKFISKKVIRNVKRDKKIYCGFDLLSNNLIQTYVFTLDKPILLTLSVPIIDILFEKNSEDVIVTVDKILLLV